MLNIVANINSARLMFTNISVHRADLTFRSKVNAIHTKGSNYPNGIACRLSSHIFSQIKYLYRQG